MIVIVIINTSLLSIIRRRVYIFFRYISKTSIRSA